MRKEKIAASCSWKEESLPLIAGIDKHSLASQAWRQLQGSNYYFLLLLSWRDNSYQGKKRRRKIGKIARKIMREREKMAVPVKEVFIWQRHVGISIIRPRSTRCTEKVLEITGLCCQSGMG